MPTGYQIKDQSALYYLTLQIVQWADIFTRQIYRDIVVDSIRFCRKEKGLEVFAYVIMSNHVHLIVRSKENKLSDTIRDLKRHTSKKIIENVKEHPESRKDWMLMIFKYAAKKYKRNNEFQVWTHENHAIELDDVKMIDQRIEYIHLNPVKSGIVLNAEDYLYSSARNYTGLENMMEIDMIND